MMSIKVKETSMITPAEATPKTSLWLSKLDMIIRTPYSHTNVLFLYNNHNNDDNNSSSTYFDTNILKESLSKSLVPFYPMAGRLTFDTEKQRYEIDCNAEGALFIEAESPQTLAEFGDYTKLECQLRKFVFPKCDYSNGLSSFPLLLVQVTRFKCGSVSLGFAQHHHVADGFSHLHFINSWARLAKGLEIVIEPVHDRATYLSPRQPPLVQFQHLEYDPPLPPMPLSDDMATTEECVLELTKQQMITLKQQATLEDYKPSTFEVQASHVWRIACKARGLSHDEDAKLYIPIDGRSRLKDTLPQGYCGNTLFHAICLEKAGDVISKPIWFAASKIREAIKKWDDINYLKSSIDYVESYPNLTDITLGPNTFTSPNLTINSWVRLPCLEADFGWNGPNYMGINGIKYEGITYITSSPKGDGTFLVAIKLFSPHMALFKKYFYDF